MTKQGKPVTLQKVTLPMDNHSTQQRRNNMAAIRSKDTKPERIVRHGLWSLGFRYRLNSPRLPGHPDLVLRKYRTCIFVNGCFWHGHLVRPPFEENSQCCKIPKTNRDFWVNKIHRNQERDLKDLRQLAQMGWHCITVWECVLTPKKQEDTLRSLAFTLNHIWLQDHGAKTLYSLPEEEAESWKAAEERLND